MSRRNRYFRYIYPEVIFVIIIIVGVIGWQVYETHQENRLRAWLEARAKPMAQNDWTTYATACAIFKYPVSWSSPEAAKDFHDCSFPGLWYDFYAPQLGAINLVSEPELREKATHTNFGFQIRELHESEADINNSPILTDVNSPARKCSIQQMFPTCLVHQVISLNIPKSINTKLIVFSTGTTIRLAVSDDPNAAVSQKDFIYGAVINGKLVRLDGYISYTQEPIHCPPAYYKYCGSYAADPNTQYNLQSYGSIKSFETTETFKDFTQILNSLVIK
jgi:hypothetical protein